MSEPILTGSGLNNKDIVVPAFKEYRNGNPFAWAMGNNENAIIQEKLDTSKGRGDTIYFSLRDAFDPANAITGNSQVEGNEQDLTYNEDSVTMDEINHAGKVERRHIVNVRTPLQVVEALRPTILDMASERLRNDLIDSAAVSATPNRTRVLFGATDGNFNATLATALANVDSSADKMSADIVRLARLKALNVAKASNGTSTRKIRPFKVKMANGALVETYVMFLDSMAANDLQQDTDFKDLRDDARRNEISIPLFNGAKYLGMVHGVMCYEIEELDRIDSDAGGASNIRVAHNLLCGAQAFGVGVSLPGRLAAKEFDYGRHVGMNYQVIRGIKMLKFDSIEQGVVHVYTSGEFSG